MALVYILLQNIDQSHFCRQVGFLHVPCHMLSGVLTTLGFTQSKLFNQAKGEGQGARVDNCPWTLCH